MQAKVRCAVLMPVGPDIPMAYVEDTIASVNYFLGAGRTAVAVVDDSRRGACAGLAKQFDNVLVLTARDYQLGTAAKSEDGSVFGKMIAAINELRAKVRFDVLLKIDTDALIIGPSPDVDALNFMAAHPDVGMVGAFTRRGDGSDKRGAMRAKGEEITREMGWWSGRRKPRVAATIRRLVRAAERTPGYTRGDTATGGAYFVSAAACDAMAERGLFDLDLLHKSKVPEDTMIVVFNAACGYRLADLPEADDVLAINWRGLPMPLDELVARKKKIVHPIKEIGDPDFEPRVRAYFKQRRVGSGVK